MNLITTGRISDREVLERNGFHCLDITVKSSKGKARSLAPTWKMVTSFKKGIITWEEYSQQYERILCAAQERFPKTWLATCQLPKVAFLCFCTDENYCHRTLCAWSFFEFARKENIASELLSEHTPGTGRG